MEIIRLQEKMDMSQSKKLNRRYSYYQNLLEDLRSREIPDSIIQIMNQDIEALNSFEGTPKEWSKQLRKTIHKSLQKLEKDLKIVPKNLFRGRWMAIGLSVFGVPLGVSFGASLGNMGFLGIGIPIGMVIGMAIGAGMDKTAEKEGRQLSVEAMY